MKTILTTITLLIICLHSYSQINIGGKPYSFIHEIKPVKTTKNETSRIELPELDFSKLKAEDEINDSGNKPYRYGIPIDVNYNLTNSGEWIDLENGDRLWKLAIQCPSAKTIHLTYDKFWIPEGGLLYIYDKNKSLFIGGFSKKNNKGTWDNPSKYATGLIHSDEIILEYYEPKAIKNRSIISIAKIVYGYRNLGITSSDTPNKSFGSATCSVNINCSPEGDDWQDEKTSVAMILLHGGQGTGSLINNTRGNGILYFLTADHVIAEDTLDAITKPDASYDIFYWNYESSGCTNGSNFAPFSTVGATLVANNPYTDFALFQLTESPYDLSPPIPAYLNGWDRRIPSAPKVISIHHPAGDIKKISTDSNSLADDGGSLFWWTHWDETNNGNSKTYVGSSGAPLFNTQSRVIGQLNGIPLPTHNTCTDQWARSGKFGVSWDNDSDPRRRLKDWLDPDNTNVDYLDGTYCSGTESIANTDYYTDVTINRCIIELHNVEVKNGAKVTFDADKYITISGEFEVVLGSEVEFK